MTTLPKLASYQKAEAEKVRCLLCPHRCLLGIGQTGLCRGRKNLDGSLYALTYGKVTSMALDPIEKKPLRHFHPGSSILSVGTFGCNLACDFCQNWSISQSNGDDLAIYEISPEGLVDKAIELKPQSNIGVAFTYNEPTIWFEYVLDTAKLLKDKGLKVVLVTNGFINQEPLAELLPFVDALNIDLKAFTDRFYRSICRGGLSEVQRTIELSARYAHVEISTLLIPGLNDSVEEIGELAKWLSSIDRQIPLHLSRYFPRYKRTEPPPTPLSNMERCLAAAQPYLDHVYLGNCR